MPWIESQIEQQNASPSNEVADPLTRIPICSSNCDKIVPKKNGKILSATARSIAVQSVSGFLSEWKLYKRMYCKRKI